MDIMRYFRDKANWLSQSVYVTLTLFFKTEIQNHASGLALYFFLSAVPLVYLLNTIISGNLELSKALYFLLNMLHLNFINVDFSKSSDQYYGLFKVTSWVSILVLLWSSRGLMRSIHGAFAVIFASPKRMHFIAINLIAFMILPFSFLVLGIWIMGDYLALLYSASSKHIIAQMLEFVSVLSPLLVTWAITFLAYYFMPPSRPRPALAIAISFVCALMIVLLQFLTNTVFKVDQYIRIYGSLGAIIFSMIWAYIVSFIFLVCAEFLHVSGRIDMIAMEKIFLGSEKRGRLATGIEHFLFKRSERLFEKYGRSCHQDEVIIRQNADPSGIYFLYSGKVGIYESDQEKNIRKGEVRAGELFGEIEYLLGRAPSSTFVAESKCFLFTLPPEIFEGLLNSSLKISRLVIDSLCRSFPKRDEPPHPEA